MPASEFEQVAFSASLDCRYLLHVPQVVDPTTPALVALHGYASNPDDILGFTKMVAGADSVIAAIQAPHQQYLPQNGSGTLPGPGAKTGYNWGVGVHWKSAVALHHAMVLRVLESLRLRFGTPANRLILLGFSQPVGLNYRFAATHPDSIGGVIGICGGIPKDCKKAPTSRSARRSCTSHATRIRSIPSRPSWNSRSVFFSAPPMSSFTFCPAPTASLPRAASL